MGLMKEVTKIILPKSNPEILKFPKFPDGRLVDNEIHCYRKNFRYLCKSL